MIQLRDHQLAILNTLQENRKGERALRDIRLKNLGKTSEKELKHKVTSK